MDCHEHNVSWHYFEKRIECIHILNVGRVWGWGRATKRSDMIVPAGERNLRNSVRNLGRTTSRLDVEYLRNSKMSSISKVR